MKIISGKFNFAKHLRTYQTPSEKKLWYKLRAKKFHNLKFRRQVPIGKFIVDFACIEKMIVVEVDGWIHEYQKQKDKRRDDFLRYIGFTVLRFSNEEVKTNISDVLEQIYEHAIAKLPSPIGRGIEGEGI